MSLTAQSQLRIYRPSPPSKLCWTCVDCVESNEKPSFPIFIFLYNFQVCLRPKKKFVHIHVSKFSGKMCNALKRNFLFMSCFVLLSVSDIRSILMYETSKSTISQKLALSQVRICIPQHSFDPVFMKDVKCAETNEK